jgi:hypothetical protein
MRRIRNISSEPLEVPLLNTVIQPGDVAEVPENLDYVDFSEALFEIDGGATASEGDTQQRPRITGPGVAPVPQAQEQAQAKPEGVTE